MNANERTRLRVEAEKSNGEEFAAAILVLLDEVDGLTERLACRCPDPLRAISPACALHGHSPESAFLSARDGAS